MPVVGEMACAKMKLESTDEDAGDLDLNLKVCVINKACGVETEKEGVRVKFECETDSAKKLIAGLATLATAVYAMWTTWHNSIKNIRAVDFSKNGIAN